MTHMKLDSSHLDHEPKLVHFIHTLAAQEPGVFYLANGVLVEIRTWGLLGRLTLIQEQRRPLPAGRGG